MKVQNNEIWLEFIFENDWEIDRKLRDSLLLNLVIPVLDKFDSKNSEGDFLKTFHYSWQPKLLVRFEFFNEDQISEAKRITRKINLSKENFKIIFPDEETNNEYPKYYYGERKNYGQSWDNVKKFFEMYSRFNLKKLSLLKKESGEKTNSIKLIHCYINNERGPLYRIHEAEYYFFLFINAVIVNNDYFKDYNRFQDFQKNKEFYMNIMEKIFSTSKSNIDSLTDFLAKQNNKLLKDINEKYPIKSK